MPGGVPAIPAREVLGDVRRDDDGVAVDREVAVRERDFLLEERAGLEACRRAFRRTPRPRTTACRGPSPGGRTRRRSRGCRRRCRRPARSTDGRRRTGHRRRRRRSGGDRSRSRREDRDARRRNSSIAACSPGVKSYPASAARAGRAAVGEASSPGTRVATAAFTGTGRFSQAAVRIAAAREAASRYPTPRVARASEVIVFASGPPILRQRRPVRRSRGFHFERRTRCSVGPRIS